MGAGAGEIRCVEKWFLIYIYYTYIYVYIYIYIYIIHIYMYIYIYLCKHRKSHMYWERPQQVDAVLM